MTPRVLQYIQSIIVLCTLLGGVFLFTRTGIDEFDTPKRLIISNGLLLLSISVLFSGLRERREVHVVQGLALLLMFWMCLRTAFRQEVFAEFEVLMTWILPVLAMIIGAGLHPRVWRVTTRYFSAIVWGLGAVMVAQFLNHDPLFSDATAGLGSARERMIGTIGYQNQAAAVVSLLGGVFALRLPWLWLRSAVFGFVLLVVMMTGCRGATAGMILGGCAACVIFFEIRHSILRRLLLLFFVCAVVGVVVAYFIPGGLDRFLLPVERSVGGLLDSRKYLFQTAVALFLESPWIGHGAGEYAIRYIELLAAVLPADITHAVLKPLVFAREPHNDLLQFAAEFGAVGCVLAALLAVAVFNAFRRAREKGVVEPGGIALYVFVYMFVHCLVSFPWQMGVAGPVAGLLLGMLLAAGNTAASPTEERGRRFGVAVCRVVTVVCALGVSYFFVSEWRIQRALYASHSRAKVQQAAEKIQPWGYTHAAYVGNWFCHQGDYQEALYYLEWAKRGHSDILLLNNLGRCYGELGRWEAAVQAFQTWVDSGIGHETALLNLSIAKEKAGDPSGAADVLLTRAELWPTRDPNHFLRVGSLLIMANRPQEAVEQLRLYAHYPVRIAATFHQLHRPKKSIDRDTQLTWVRYELDAERNLESVGMPRSPELQIVAMTGKTREGEDVFIDLMSHFSYWAFTTKSNLPAPGLTFDRKIYSMPGEGVDSSGILKASGQKGVAAWKILDPTGLSGPNSFIPAGAEIDLPDQKFSYLDILCASVDPRPVRGVVQLNYENDEAVFKPFYAAPWSDRKRPRKVLKNEDHARLLNVLGAAWMRQGDTASAEIQFREALRLVPGYITAQRNLEQISGNSAPELY